MCSALLNWRKNSNFFKLAVLRSDSIKRNYGRFIYNENHGDIKGISSRSQFSQKWQMSGSVSILLLTTDNLDQENQDEKCDVAVMYVDCKLSADILYTVAKPELIYPKNAGS